MVIYFGGSAEGMYGQSCGSAKVVPAHIALGLYVTWSIGQRLRKKYEMVGMVLYAICFPGYEMNVTMVSLKRCIN